MPIIRITNRRNRNLGLFIIENAPQVCCLAARLGKNLVMLFLIVIFAFIQIKDNLSFASIYSLSSGKRDLVKGQFHRFDLFIV